MSVRYGRVRAEVVDKYQLLEEAESFLIETQRKAALLKLANRSLRVDWDNVQSIAEVREVRLEERIGDLEKENFELLERISVIEGKNARLFERPSTSHAFEFPTVP